MINTAIDYPKLIGLKFEDCLALPINVYLIDRGGTLIECNDKQALVLGHEKMRDIIGSKPIDFMDESSSEVIKKVNAGVFETGKPTTTIEKAKFNHLPNVESSFFSLKFPFPNQMNKIIGVWGFSFSFHDFSPNGSPNGSFVIDDLIYKKEVSKRESECIKYLLQGLTAKQIARKLTLSPRTIEFYIQRIKMKFGCIRTTELISKLFSNK